MIARVKFLKRFAIYNDNEVAGFSTEKALELVNGGFAVMVDPLPEEVPVQALKNDGSATLTKPLDPNATKVVTPQGLPSLIAPAVKKG